MPLKITFDNRGIQGGFGKGDIRKNLPKLMKQMPREVARATAAEWQIEKRESMKKTPWDTKRLMRTHRVLTPEITQGKIYSGLTVGDETTESYAIPVHEDLEMNHPHGEAKFLESTVREAAPFMIDRIARRVNLQRALDDAEIEIPEDYGGEEV